MKYLSALTVVLFFFTSAFAQIPKVGTDSLLEIGTWNTEWFGDPGNGPSNETTQYNNVQSILQQTGVDIWGLEEISDAQTWNTLVANLSTKYLSYIATYTQTQKTAVLYDKNKFQLITSQTGHVLTESEFSYDFGGRPPLCVALKTKNRPVVDTLYVFVIHMKAYADQDSYNRRLGAGQKLKTYLDANMNGKRWVVCGDWNDDLYTSIYKSNPSPYLNFADDSKYVFISRELTDAGKRSYVSGRMIDHILMSARMKDWYLKKTARVLDELPSVISGYSSNTSDHYPVIGLFDDRVKTPPVTGVDDVAGEPVHILCYPNPANDKIFVQTETNVEEAELYTLSGALVTTVKPAQNAFILSLPSSLQKGIYVLTIRTSEGIAHTKISLIH
jgi:endonuclease/exonuclease/phosphatase family metal-dependent hydrolase